MQPRILMVDDMPDMVRFLTLILGRFGGFTNLCGAQNGMEALKILEADPVPDLIILDDVMPGMDGVDVCRVIRADARLAQIPILMTTVRGTDQNVSLCRQAGANDVAILPAHPRTLFETVQSLLGIATDTLPMP